MVSIEANFSFGSQSGRQFTRAGRTQRPEAADPSGPLPEPVACIHRGVERHNGDAMDGERLVVEVAQAAGATQVVIAAGGHGEVGQSLGPALAGRNGAAFQHFTTPAESGEQGEGRCPREVRHTVRVLEPIEDHVQDLTHRRPVAATPVVLANEQADRSARPARLDEQRLVDERRAPVGQVRGEREPLLPARVVESRESGAVLVIPARELNSWAVRQKQLQPEPRPPVRPSRPPAAPRKTRRDPYGPPGGPRPTRSPRSSRGGLTRAVRWTSRGSQVATDGTWGPRIGH